MSYLTGYGFGMFRIRTDGTEDPTAWSYTPDWPKAGQPLQGPIAFTGPLGADGVPGGGADMNETSDIGFDSSSHPFMSGLMLTSTNDLRLIVYRAMATLEPDAGFGPDVVGTPPHSPARGFRVFDATAGGTSIEAKPEGVSLAVGADGLLATTRSRLLDGDGIVLKVDSGSGLLVAAFGAGGIAFSGQVANGDFLEGSGPFGLSILPDNSLQIADQRVIAYNDDVRTAALTLTRLTAAGLPDASFDP